MYKMMSMNLMRGMLVNKAVIKSLTQCRYGHIIAVHRDTKYNNPKIPFKFTKENMERAKTIVAKYPSQYKKAAVMPLLDLGQRQLGFTSISVMNYVAKLLDMPPMRVYEVASFYTMYHRTPVGKYHVQVCMTTPCQLCGSKNLMDTVVRHLGIKPGQTTADGIFSLEEVECLGACVNAPMMQINDDYFEDLDSKEKVVKILDDLKAGRQPKIGTTKRVTCVPFSGPRVLKGEPLNVQSVTRKDL